MARPARAAPRARPAEHSPSALEYKPVQHKRPLNPAGLAPKPANFTRSRHFAFVTAGVIAFGLGLYGTSLYMSYAKIVADSPVEQFGSHADGQVSPSSSSVKSVSRPVGESSLSSQTPSPPKSDDRSHDLSAIYDDTAADFDSTVSMSERLMGVTGLRRRLVREARGHVLESAAGTGRNTELYRLNLCSSVTLVDRSGPMLAVAERKWVEGGKGGLEQRRERRKVIFRAQSVMDGMPVPKEEGGMARSRGETGDDRERGGKNKPQQIIVAPPPDLVAGGGDEGSRGEGVGYDTVVQTMGLCSTEDPDALLHRLGQLVRPGNEGGRILLLEHGRGHYNWLNRILDSLASRHASKHGCWWNRDVGDIVQRSGLEVQKMERHHFGTTWWVELRKGKGWSGGERSRRAGEEQREREEVHAKR